MQLSHGFSFTAKLATLPGRLIRDIAETGPPAAATWLLTCETTAQPTLRNALLLCEHAKLVDEVGTGVDEAPRDALPGTSLMQVIHVRDGNSIRQTANVSAKV